MKRTRSQPTRTAAQTASSSDPLTLDAQALRSQRHLDDLERSNYVEPSSEPISNIPIASTNNVGKEQDDGFGEWKSKAASEEQGKRGSKKSSMNVRSLLLYRKNLKTLIEESVSHLSPVKNIESSFFLGRQIPSFACSKLSQLRRPTSESTTHSSLFSLRLS
jgi:hypothetical protein